MTVFLPYSSCFPRLTAADGLFLFGVKKKQKTPAENFSFEVSGLALSVKPEKFVRPDLSRTGMRCYGLVGWKYTVGITLIFKWLQNNVNGSLSKDQMFFIFDYKRSSTTCPDFLPIVWTHLLGTGFLGVMLACLNNTQVLPKNAVNPKGQGNQKNSCRKEQIALPNLKRSGFVFIEVD
ncbi:hypothetical protein QF042_001476 [Pedobacter sp. W3I1]|nr:hypothetical protein [Pedobacter sp. W3I1]